MGGNTEACFGYKRVMRHALEETTHLKQPN